MEHFQNIHKKRKAEESLKRKKPKKIKKKDTHEISDKKIENQQKVDKIKIEMMKRMNNQKDKDSSFQDSLTQTLLQKEREIKNNLTNSNKIIKKYGKLHMNTIKSTLNLDTGFHPKANIMGVLVDLKQFSFKNSHYFGMVTVTDESIYPNVYNVVINRNEVTKEISPCMVGEIIVIQNGNIYKESPSHIIDFDKKMIIKKDKGIFWIQRMNEELGKFAEKLDEESYHRLVKLREMEPTYAKNEDRIIMNEHYKSISDFTSDSIGTLNGDIIGQVVDFTNDTFSLRDGTTNNHEQEDRKHLMHCKINFEEKFSIVMQFIKKNQWIKVRNVKYDRMGRCLELFTHSNIILLPEYHHAVQEIKKNQENSLFSVPNFITDRLDVTAIEAAANTISTQNVEPPKNKETNRPSIPDLNNDVAIRVEGLEDSEIEETNMDDDNMDDDEVEVIEQVDNANAKMTDDQVEVIEQVDNNASAKMTDDEILYDEEEVEEEVEEDVDIEEAISEVQSYNEKYIHNNARLFITSHDHLNADVASINFIQQYDSSKPFRARVLVEFIEFESPKELSEIVQPSIDGVLVDDIPADSEDDLQYQYFLIMKVKQIGTDDIIEVILNHEAATTFFGLPKEERKEPLDSSTINHLQRCIYLMKTSQHYLDLCLSVFEHDGHRRYALIETTLLM